MMKRIATGALLVWLLAGCAVQPGTQQQLVDSSTLALESVVTAPGGQQVQSVLRHARAVVICPNNFRAGFVFGGEGGLCVMAARAAGGSWSNPAFYSLGSGSFGFQIGVQNAQVLMLVMTDGGLNALLNSQFKFGADAGLTIATLGAGLNGSMSTAINADILTVSKSQGLYGGVTLAGSVMSNDANADQGYYGQPLDARQIVVNMAGNNQGAGPLRSILSRYGG